MAEANGWTNSWGTRQTFWPEKGICIQTSLILNSVLNVMELTNVREVMLCWNLFLVCFKACFQFLATVLCVVEMKDQVHWKNMEAYQLISKRTRLYTCSGNL